MLGLKCVLLILILFVLFFISLFYFSCLPAGYLNIFLEFHFDISLVLLSISLCIAFLVVVLGITSYIHNLSQFTDVVILPL